MTNLPDHHAMQYIKRQETGIAPFSVERFRNAFPNRVANIVGKGQSLDFLQEKYLTADPNDPIFATNQAIQIVERLELDRPTFLVQQDAGLKERSGPKSAALLLHDRLTKTYKDYPWRFFYEGRRYGLSRASLTAESAIVCAKIMGCSFVRMICFDASVTGDLRYARCFCQRGKPKVGPDYYLAFRFLLEKHLRGMPTEWILPQGDEADVRWFGE